MIVILTVLLLFTVGLAISTDKVRWLILGLAAHYLIVTALGSKVAYPGWLASYLVAGLVTCLVLFLTMRKLAVVVRAKRFETRAQDEVPQSDTSYRLAALALAAIVTYSLSESYPLPDISGELSFAIYWISAAGLFSLIVSRGALRTSIGLLMIASASQLVFGVINVKDSPIYYSISAITAILVALAISFLLAGEELSDQVDRRDT